MYQPVCGLWQPKGISESCSNLCNFLLVTHEVQQALNLLMSSPRCSEKSWLGFGVRLLLYLIFLEGPGKRVEQDAICEAGQELKMSWCLLRDVNAYGSAMGASRAPVIRSPGSI